MIYNLIATNKNQWLASDSCTIKSLINYIRSVGFLRDTQIEAIETYLFLKIVGQNKPLYQLFNEGFFLNNENLSNIALTAEARNYLETNISARSLFEFTRIKKNSTETLLPELEKFIIANPSALDYQKIFKDIFYGIDYSDYLFSLPMGAGKTFLMASFIYLDLYFAQLEPENKLFAHNFIILVPSGLKSSIVPSLKSIEKFDPVWLLPKPAASEIKKILSFEVLDQPKSAKKSNRAKNPNAQKVNQHLSGGNPFGLVFVVNAEKVILDRLDLSDQLKLIEHSEDEKDRQANELRNIIGKLPNLQIHIDEVHHAAKDDIKLRQVVTKWNANGTINSVLGYSGTPYLSSADDIVINNDLKLRFAQITNTVYYYSLLKGVQSFLKKPKVKKAEKLSSLQIIQKGVEEFKELYWNKVYNNGTIAKLGIYCGSINRLETEVFPFLINTLKIDANDILKYHKGNKQFKLPKENELEWNLLDTPFSKKKIVLLVQVGKEGWDCKSLTGIVLSQSGDCPKNMVLQTSCRCLRQVDKGVDESALIWLSEDNANTLDGQLQEEQQTSIAELNSIGRKAGEQILERFSRMEHLQLPEVDFYQLKVNYKTLVIEDHLDTTANLSAVFSSLKKLMNSAVITESGFDPGQDKTRTFIHQIGDDSANFNNWLLEISKESFFTISLSQLKKHSHILKSIFDKITYSNNGSLFFNDLYNQQLIKTKVRLSFSIKRDIESETETIEENANLLLIENLQSIPFSEKVYPSQKDVNDIIRYDNTKLSISELENEITKENDRRKAAFEASKPSGLFAQIAPDLVPPLNNVVKIKEKTFHYLPYNFSQSGFEKNILTETFTLSHFKNKNLEIYYNGDRFLTSFKIKCFAKLVKSWHYIGEYTPDFLIIERMKNKIYRALIIETKGKLYAEDKTFQKKKYFVESEFLKQNNDKFGYKRFDFLYLEEIPDFNSNLSTLNNKIFEFFY